MSSFVAKSNHREPIEWRERAFETLDQDSYMLDTAVALFAGLGVASFASPIAGIAIGLLMVKRIFDKETQKQKAKDLIIKNGLAAPFLEGDDFQDFVEQAGRDAVYQELKFADTRGVELSNRAWDFPEQYELKHDKPVLPQAEDTSNWAHYPPDPVQSRETVNSSKIAAFSQQNMTQAQPPVAPQNVRKIMNIAEMMAAGKFIISRIIIGASRTGKSQLASDALGFVRLRFGQNVSIFYISAGFIPEEDGRYWSMCDRVSGFYFPELSDTQKRLAYGVWNDLLEEFTTMPSSVERPKILVIDELNSIMGTAVRLDSAIATQFVNGVKGKLADISSMGSKRGLVIWALAPTGAMGDLGLTKANVTAMNPIFVAQVPTATPGWNETTYLTAKNNGLAPERKPDRDVLDECEELGLDRLIGVAGRWLPLMNSTKVAANFTSVSSHQSIQKSDRQRLEELVESSSPDRTRYLF
ncbi:hypothetical protein [Leptolyngbya sp. NIES-2104]|uniref:hypothetical protein n=1 Tax=Leptolyngbya sp. NIES-2104 TaxID=1552121 RepID=UPI0006ECA4E2|nr:hypothetical protein [Leptolyngbya sp. NIES-2104]GAP99090.1 hypothetical protein NIES2104_56470 [Leptolyngbya sp. NIES-2104]